MAQRPRIDKAKACFLPFDSCPAIDDLTHISLIQGSYKTAWRYPCRLRHFLQNIENMTIDEAFRIENPGRLDDGYLPIVAVALNVLNLGRNGWNLAFK
jgi:hypothetical protein